LTGGIQRAKAFRIERFACQHGITAEAGAGCDIAIVGQADVCPLPQHHQELQFMGKGKPSRVRSREAENPFLVQNHDNIL